MRLGGAPATAAPTYPVPVPRSVRRGAGSAARRGRGGGAARRRGALLFLYGEIRQQLGHVLLLRSDSTGTDSFVVTEQCPGRYGVDRAVIAGALPESCGS